MLLLPLAGDPFTAPTDRALTRSERREFVRTHRTCLFEYGRNNEGPSTSVVYYIPTYGQPPRHLHENEQEEQVTHWISGAVPWDAADPT